jgi:hypothetical protein
MESGSYDEIQRTLATAGPAAAIDQLCQTLRASKDYANLFYALLLKKRRELGVSLVPTGTSSDLPEGLQEPYENAIREAGRLVGRLFLEEGNIPHAWAYFRMLGEPEAVARALDQVQLGDGEDCQQLVDIAFHQGANPRKGFDWILERYGICSAITTISSQQTQHPLEVQQYCIKRLVRALYEELRVRLAADIARREGATPVAQTVRGLMAGNDWLFEDEFYHIDVSHLGSVVQMSVHLPPGEELELARELCEYGRRLAPRFRYPGEPPFEDQYQDIAIYLAALAGDNVEEGIRHFQDKVENAEPDSRNTYPAEVLVNLLVRLGRPAQALTVARRYLASADDRALTCPSIPELCQRLNDYRTLAEVAREQDNPVHYVAGLIAAGTA